MKKASTISFRAPILLNKMGWLKGTTVLSPRWQEPCLMNIRPRINFGRRRSTWCVMQLTASTSTSFYRRHFMSSKPVTNSMSPTFDFLEVSDIFYKRDQSLLNLLLRLMNVSYLVMIQTLAHTIFSMSPLVVLKPHVIWCLMRLMALKRSKLILILSPM
jgi:hypothetical protein